MSPWTLNLEGLRHHEYWRLWTAHLYHYGWGHMLLNTVAMLLPLYLLPRRLMRWTPIWIFLAMPLIALSLLQVPSLDYQGASALAAATWGLAGAILMRLHRKEDRIWGTVLIALLVAKISSEMYGIPLPEPGMHWRSLPLAHQVGAFLGLLSGLLWPIKRTLRV